MAAAPETFACKFCCKFFFTAGEKLEHEKFHLENKKLTCPICKMGFARRSYLAEHMCIHNGEQPHSCYYCNKNFSLRCNLVRHVRIHTGEKPFTCAICKQSFTLKKNMMEHQRIHTGERPFKCPKCEYSFSRRSSLVRHARIHTGQKSYQCHECKKLFSWKYYLRRHVSTHLKKKTKSIRKRRTKQQIALDAAAAKMSVERKTLVVSLPAPETYLLSNSTRKQDSAESCNTDTVNLQLELTNIKIEESENQPITIFLPAGESLNTEVENLYEENIVKIEPVDEINQPANVGNNKPEDIHRKLENICPPSYVVLPPLPLTPAGNGVLTAETDITSPNRAENQLLTFSMTRQEYVNYQTKKLFIKIPALSEQLTAHDD